MKKPKQFVPNRFSSGKTFKLPRLYDDPEWVRYSRKFLMINTKCYACSNRSQATDHFVAHKNDKELFWKLDNMVPLCNACHNTVTSNYDKFNPPLTDKKLEWFNNMRVVTGTTVIVKVVPLEYTRKPDRE